jgi:hypothetical protein
MLTELYSKCVRMGPVLLGTVSQALVLVFLCILLFDLIAKDIWMCKKKLAKSWIELLETEGSQLVI